MNPGRAMAQSAHAANQFIFTCGGKEGVKSWQESGCGFGTTICLSATKDEIKQIVKASRKKFGVISGLVFDPTYKYSVDKEVADFIEPCEWSAPAYFGNNGMVTLFRNELTCGYVFVQDGSPDQKELVGSLPLHP